MPTQIDALSMVYARSLFELAEEADRREKILEVADELEQIAELLRQDRGFRELMASPIIERSRRSKAIRGIFENRITDLTLRFLLVLNQKGRLARFESIAAAFDQLVQEKFGKVEVDVFTAAPLGGEQLHEIKDRIQRALGREPVLHPYTDATMIGGIKLRVGDQLIDGSVAAQLRRMKSDILNNSPALRSRLERFIDERGA